MLEKSTKGNTTNWLLNQIINNALREELAPTIAKNATLQNDNPTHDRFMIIDDVVYHIGASLKDLGKAWFAFTKMNDISANELLARIK